MSGVDGEARLSAATLNSANEDLHHQSRWASVIKVSAELQLKLFFPSIRHVLPI